MEEKYLLISLEDEKAKHLSSVLKNKTAKKIIDALAEKELSQKDIADKLKIPLNTVEYNLNKLIKSEIVEKSSTWFWSQKGKKIPTYKLSNKSIIIAPKNSNIKSKLKSILPAFAFAGLGTILVKLYSTNIKTTQTEQDMLFATADITSKTILSPQPFPAWAWFLAGSIIAITIYTIVSWRKL